MATELKNEVTQMIHVLLIADGEMGKGEPGDGTPGEAAGERESGSDAETFALAWGDAGSSWTFECGASLAEGLALLQSGDADYDAVLLDLSLPGCGGLDTLLAVRRQHDSLPIVVLLAAADRELGLQAVKYGAQDALIAGCDAGQLQRSLQLSIARQQLLNSFQHASLHDPLTGLANRNLFLTLLQQALDRRSRNPEQLFAVLFLDLDHFKHINDAHGHLTGDRVLSELAQRLKGCLRTSDVVSRLAGDEFGVLVEDLQDPLDVLPVVHRIAQVIGKPLCLPGHELGVSASIGVALSDRPCLNAVELLENADLAMYQAKLNGKATYCIFNDHMNHEKQVISQLEDCLRSGIRESGLLRLSYRPVIAVADGHPYGLETDIQCQGTDWQSVPFSELLRLCGGTGMLDALNGWLCEELNGQMHQWDRVHANDWKLFLQLAPEQLRARELHRQLESLLLAGDLPPGRFYLALKESLLHHPTSFQELVPLLRRLHAQGFRLYLEDFGGSYTVLNSLSQIPVDMVKINLDTLTGLMPASERFLVLAPVIELARNLGMQVMLSGVRNETDMGQLQALEAVFAQGSFFSAPLSGKETEAWF